MEKLTNVDRDTASRINPFISSLWTEDTLHSMSSVVRELGYLISSSDGAPEHLYRVFETISAALAWETDNIVSCKQARKEKEAGNG